MTDVSLDGRRFRSIENEDGEVGAETRFEYHEEDGPVWARYSGGGRTATGHTESRVERLADDRVRLREEWVWDPREGPGMSVVEEITESRRA